jgi:hypothetical protein
MKATALSGSYLSTAKYNADPKKTDQQSLGEGSHWPNNSLK